MIRRYADGSIRFEGKDAEVERLALRAVLAERRAFEERLHAEHMRLLGQAEPTATKCEVVHVVAESEEALLWRAWSAYRACR